MAPAAESITSSTPPSPQDWIDDLSYEENFVSVLSRVMELMNIFHLPLMLLECGDYTIRYS